jgi:hypothetical protein
MTRAMWRVNDIAIRDLHDVRTSRRSSTLRTSQGGIEMNPFAFFATPFETASTVTACPEWGARQLNAFNSGLRPAGDCRFTKLYVGENGR